MSISSLFGPKILIRSEAQALGLLRYYTGIPCPRGHLAERWVSAKECVECLRDKTKLARRRRYAANPERYRAEVGAYRLDNPEIGRGIRARRRALKAGAVGTYTYSDILRILDRQGYLCVNPYCAKNIFGCYTIDHKTPLSRGGSNWPRNIQLLCFPCNSGKGARTQREWINSMELNMAKIKPASIAAEYEYGTTKIRGKDGKVRSSRGNGDAVAKAMLLFTSGGGEMSKVIKDNKLIENHPHFDFKKRGPKGPGLVRMAIGVMLRALVRNGTPVKIGKETVEKLNQKVDLPVVVKRSTKVEKTERAAPKAKKAKAAKPRKARAKRDQTGAGDTAVT